MNNNNNNNNNNNEPTNSTCIPFPGVSKWIRPNNSHILKSLLEVLNKYDVFTNINDNGKGSKWDLAVSEFYDTRLSVMGYTGKQKNALTKEHRASRFKTIIINKLYTVIESYINNNNNNNNNNSNNRDCNNNNDNNNDTVIKILYDKIKDYNDRVTDYQNKRIHISKERNVQGYENHNKKIIINNNNNNNKSTSSNSMLFPRVSWWTDPKYSHILESLLEVLNKYNVFNDIHNNGKQSKWDYAAKEFYDVKLPTMGYTGKQKYVLINNNTVGNHRSSRFKKLIIRNLFNTCHSYIINNNNNNNNNNIDCNNDNNNNNNDTVIKILYDKIKDYNDRVIEDKKRIQASKEYVAKLKGIVLVQEEEEEENHNNNNNYNNKDLLLTTNDDDDNINKEETGKLSVGTAVDVVQTNYNNNDNNEPTSNNNNQFNNTTNNNSSSIPFPGVSKWIHPKNSHILESLLEVLNKHDVFSNINDNGKGSKWDLAASEFYDVKLSTMGYTGKPKNALTSNPRDRASRFKTIIICKLFTVCHSYIINNNNYPNSLNISNNNNNNTIKILYDKIKDYNNRVVEAGQNGKYSKKDKQNEIVVLQEENYNHLLTTENMVNDDYKNEEEEKKEGSCSTTTTGALSVTVDMLQIKNSSNGNGPSNTNNNQSNTTTNNSSTFPDVSYWIDPKYSHILESLLEVLNKHDVFSNINDNRTESKWDLAASEFYDVKLSTMGYTGEQKNEKMVNDPEQHPSCFKTLIISKLFTVCHSYINNNADSNNNNNIIKILHDKIKDYNDRVIDEEQNRKKAQKGIVVQEVQEEHDDDNNTDLLLNNNAIISNTSNNATTAENMDIEDDSKNEDEEGSCTSSSVGALSGTTDTLQTNNNKNSINDNDMNCIKAGKKRTLSEQHTVNLSDLYDNEIACISGRLYVENLRYQKIINELNACCNNIQNLQILYIYLCANKPNNDNNSNNITNNSNKKSKQQQSDNNNDNNNTNTFIPLSPTTFTNYTTTNASTTNADNNNNNNNNITKDDNNINNKENNGTESKFDNTSVLNEGTSFQQQQKQHENDNNNTANNNNITDAITAADDASSASTTTIDASIVVVKDAPEGFVHNDSGKSASLHDKETTTLQQQQQKNKTNKSNDNNVAATAAACDSAMDHSMLVEDANTDNANLQASVLPLSQQKKGADDSNFSSTIDAAKGGTLSKTTTTAPTTTIDSSGKTVVQQKNLFNPAPADGIIAVWSQLQQQQQEMATKAVPASRNAGSVAAMADAHTTLSPLLQQTSESDYYYYNTILKQQKQF